MFDMVFSEDLLLKIAGIGASKRSSPQLKEVEPFNRFFRNNELVQSKLDEKDDSCSRRELILRYLLLNAVLDQGPDIDGVRILLKEVVNRLYRNGLRLFHQPSEFFGNIGLVADEILKVHNFVRGIRAEKWAKENLSNPNRYNLFMDNTNQVLNYAVFRWGVPLSVPIILEKDGKTLSDYLESWKSCEIMSRQLKDHERYGLGKAIGYKAGHLYAKWYVHTFKLSRRGDKGWNKLAHELPFDSNAGRVLFRAGLITLWTNLNELAKWAFIQKGRGKGGKNYIRVTNIRGKTIEPFDNDFFEKYRTICKDYLRIKRNPRSIELQQIPNAILLGTDYGVGDLDDGLIHIGTNYCFNHEKPKCNSCLINDICKGYNEEPSLIEDYRT